MNRGGMPVTLFDADPSHAGVHHTFHAPSITMTMEYKSLRNVMDMVEMEYQDDVPLHRLPLARDPAYQPDRLLGLQSKIFIVEWTDFNKMEARQIQDIFRHRHILVRNWPEKTLKFDRAGLSMLAPMYKQTSFQGE